MRALSRRSDVEASVSRVSGRPDVRASVSRVFGRSDVQASAKGVSGRPDVRASVSRVFGRSDVQASLVAGIGSLIWLIAGVRTPDLAAQSYRVGLFEREGFAIWDNNWYAGHHVPAYSLLYPPLGALVGMRVVGVLAAVVAAFCFARLAEAHFGRGARVGILWFGLATVADLAIGRLTYALAAAIGLAAVYAASRRRLVVTVVLAVVCGVASPLAGVFVGMAAAAIVVGGWPERDLGLRRAAFCLGVPAVGAGLALTIAFGEGGREPFGSRSLIAAVVATVGFVVFVPRRERILRAGGWLYLVGTVGSFVLVTPIGDNTTRVGADFAGPVLACAVLNRRGWPSRLGALTGAVLVGLFAWQWNAPVDELAKGVGDRVSRPSTYTGLLAYLGAHDRGPGRLEVTFTRSHWEAAILAPRYPLARGWEKQLDTADDGLFYGHSLSSAAYHAWIDRLGVRYVVVSTGPLDAASKLEAKLVLGGLPYLRPVYSNRDWRVFAVVDPTRMASRPGTMTGLGGQSFTVRFSRPGTSVVRVRFSPYWQAGSACVGSGPDGFTSVTSKRAGVVRVRIGFSVGRIFDHGVRCG
ncbi:MAG TPA: hypothetical protein VHW26_11205 [Solirubrobacteraceae bacterium]|jgi:hypothetical protein|nr:hypothetical protein [Solirubrobacteraceae bacterium]